MADSTQIVQGKKFLMQLLTDIEGETMKDISDAILNNIDGKIINTFIMNFIEKIEKNTIDKIIKPIVNKIHNYIYITSFFIFLSYALIAGMLMYVIYLLRKDNRQKQIVNVNDINYDKKVQPTCYGFV